MIADIFLLLLIEDIDPVRHLLLNGQERPEQLRLALASLSVRLQVEGHLDLREAEQVGLDIVEDFRVSQQELAGNEH